MSNINVNNLTPLLGSGSSVSVSGSLVVKNDVTIGGHLYIGDQDTDSVKFTADVSSSIIPDATITYDLGSSTRQWSSIYLNSLVVNHITASGNISASGNGDNGTGSFGHVFVSGSVSASGNIGSEGTGSFLGGIDAGFNSATGSFGYISASSDISTSADIYAMDAYLGDDLWLKSDDAVILMGLDMDYSIKHDSSATSITHNVTGSYVVNASTDVILDTHAGNIFFKDCGVNQLLWDLDGTSGEVIAKLMVDGDDLVFKQFDGTEVLRLDDDGDVKVFDDLRLTSDSSVFAMGVGNDFTITHDGTTGATLAGNPITIDSAGALNLFGTSINIGTDTDVAIDIDSAALDIDASGAITIDSTSTISIDGADDMNFTITSSTDGEDLTIQQIGANDSSINITAAGTGIDAVNIDATAGDMRIAPSLSNEKTLKLGKTGAVQMVFSPHGTAASEKISIINTGGTDDEAIKIDAVAGGLLLAAGNDSLHLDADGTDADALNIDSAGGIDIDAQGVIAIDSTSTIVVSGDGGATFGDDTESLAYDGSGNLDLDAVILDIDATGASTLNAATHITTTTGLSTIDAGGQITLLAQGIASDIRLISEHTAGDAVHIDANANVGSIVNIDAGILDIDSDGATTIDAASTVTIAGATGATFGDDTEALAYDGSGNLDLDAVALDIDTSGAITIDTAGAASDIKITTAHTAGVAFHLDANANAASEVQIDAGILDIDVTGASTLNAATHVTTTTGASTIDAGGNIILQAQGSSSDIRIISEHTAGVALHIDANADAGSIVNIDAGILDIDSDGATTIDAAATVTVSGATGAKFGDDTEFLEYDGSGNLDLDAVALDVDTSGAINIAAAGTASDIVISTAHTAGVAFHLDANANAASEVQIDAGILDVDVTGVSTLNAATHVTTTTGVSVIDAGGQVTVLAQGSASDIRIVSEHTAGVALHIDANAHAASEVQIDAGILDIDVTGVATLDAVGIALGAGSGELDLTTTGLMDINSAALDIDASGAITMDGATTISIDATGGNGASKINIDTNDTTNGIQIGKVTSGVPISIGHTTSQTTVNDNFTVTGNTIVSNIKVNGGLLRPTKVITADTVLDASGFMADAGKMIVLNVAGGCGVTLPAASGTGAQYNFFVGTAITSGAYVIRVADNTDTMKGIVHMIDFDDDSHTTVTAKDTDDTITLNGGTTGGAAHGDTITLTDIAANLYVVSGNIIVAAGSNPGDPFSATV